MSNITKYYVYESNTYNVTSGYESSPIEQYDTKEKLKAALLDSLAYIQ